MVSSSYSPVTADEECTLLLLTAECVARYRIWHVLLVIDSDFGTGGVCGRGRFCRRQAFGAGPGGGMETSSGPKAISYLPGEPILTKVDRHHVELPYGQI